MDMLLQPNESVIIDLLLEKREAAPQSKELFPPELVEAAARNTHDTHVRDLAKAVWYKDGAVSKGLYKRASISSAEGDLIEQITEASTQRVLIKKYPAKTSIESFNITPDGTKLVVILLVGSFFESANQLLHIPLSQESSTQKIQKNSAGNYKILIDVIDLKTKKSLGELILREVETRIPVENFMTGMRGDIFSGIIVTNKMAILEPRSWAFATWSAVVRWDDGKINQQSIFKERGPGMAMQSSTRGLTVSNDGQVIVGTTELYLGSDQKSLQGIAIRNLKKDPLLEGESLFQPKHILTNFEDIGFTGTNPHYVFSPDSKNALILGNMGGVALIKNIQAEAPQVIPIPVDRRLEARHGAFSQDSRLFAFGGSIASRTSSPINPSPGFYKVYSLETITPEFKPFFHDDNLSIGTMTFSENGKMIANLSYDQKSVTVLDPKKGSVIKKLKGNLQVDEHFKAVWFSEHNQTLIGVTNLERLFTMPIGQ